MRPIDEVERAAYEAGRAAGIAHAVKFVELVGEAMRAETRARAYGSMRKEDQRDHDATTQTTANFEARLKKALRGAS